MTKRRASIRGRGAEILFGEPPGALDAEEADVATSADALGPDLSELYGEELERALYEEARAGAPLPDGAPARSLPWEEGVLFSPEVEAAMIEEAFAAEEPPEQGAEGPAATGEEAAVYEPPPSDDQVSGSVLPPRPPRVGPELYPDSALPLDIQQPETEVKPIELPERNLAEEERQAILQWWGDSRIAELSKAIDETYEEVRLRIGENEALTNDAYNQLLKARDILIRRDAQRIAQAEYYIEQVRVRLRRAAESEAAAKKAQWPLMGWGLLWGAAFLAMLVMAGMDWFQGLFRPAGEAQSLVELDIFLSSMLWGGIGGAVAVLYSLFKHIGMRDFDKQYIISYVGKPFMGLIVGATVYMIVALVVRALGIAPAAQAVTELEPAPAIAPGVIYLVAWAGGFKENRLLALVDRLMKQIFGSSKKEEAAPGAPTA
jgi:hypothetical protein